MFNIESESTLRYRPVMTPRINLLTVITRDGSTDLGLRKLTAPCFSTAENGD